MGARFLRGLMGFVTVIVGCILLPVIFTALNEIGSDNISGLTGLGPMVSIAPLVIAASIFASGGYMVYSAIAKGKGFDKTEVIGVVSSLVILFLGLVLFRLIITIPGSIGFHRRERDSEVHTANSF